MNRWFFLPGLGASAAMYNALRHKLDIEINFINFPVYKGEKTYAEIAKRVANDNKIGNGDVIGGSSLGGMVALDIGQVIKPKAIVLLGSAVSPNEIQNLLTILPPLATITPVDFMRVVAGEQKNLGIKMLFEADTDFIRAMCSYLPFWPGFNGQIENLYRLHGRKDRVIPCPSEGATVVDDAGHLLAMTHPNETALFLHQVNSKLKAE